MYSIKTKYSDSYSRFLFGASELCVHEYRFENEHPKLCPMCTEDEEDEYHYLLSCPALNDVRIKYLFSHLHSDTCTAVYRLLAAEETAIVRDVANVLR